ncbi:MAG: MFS transporter [Verrucomicrobiota bacterium]
MQKKGLNPHFPIDPARWPFPYAWMVAIVGTLGMIVTVPSTPPGFAPFVDPVMNDLGISRSRLTFAYTWGTIFAGLAIPFGGFWIDRLGVRVTGIIGFAGFGLSMLALGSPERMLRLFGAVGIGSETATFVFFFGIFFLLRFWGLGITMTVCRSMVFRWFVRWRSLVAGINGMILSLSFSSAPFLLNGLVVFFGWKETWLVLGVVSSIGFVVVAYLFFRESPEESGLEVDSPAKKVGLDARAPETETGMVDRDYTAFEAMKTLAFWLMLSGLSMNAFIGTGTSFHIVSLAADLGDFNREAALKLLLYVGFFNVITSLSLGFVAEKIRLRYLLFSMMIGQTLSLLGLLAFREEWGLWAYALGSGCAWGIFGILVSVPWPRFFGRKHLGSINGIVTGAVVVVSAIAPFAFGISLEQTGTYQFAVFGCLGLTPILAILGLLARNPRRSRKQSKDS